MRIAWLVPGFQGQDDEPGIPALTALARVVAQEHDLWVFSIRFPPRTGTYRVGRVWVRSFGQSSDTRSPLRRRLASLRRWRQVVRAVAEEHLRAPFAVIHGFWASEAGMLAALAARALDVPCLVSLAGGELASVRAIQYGGRLRWAERAQVALALHLATSIGVGSADARARLLIPYPWLAARVLMLPLGYDPALFSPATELGNAGPGPVVCVASWTPVKGHALLLDALAVLRERGRSPRLVLAGERTAGPEARAAVRARGLDGQASLLDVLPQAALGTLLGGARVVALASWHEAQCLAVVEALACGVPVVSTPVGIARELLTDPRLGRCLSSRSPTVLADALEDVLYHAPGADPEATLQRRMAVAHLALPSVVDRLLATYHRLAQSS